MDRRGVFHDTCHSHGTFREGYISLRLPLQLQEACCQCSTNYTTISLLSGTPTTKG